VATREVGKRIDTGSGQRLHTDEVARLAAQGAASRLALQELLGHLVDADTILATETAHMGNVVALDQIWLRVHAVEHSASALGLERLTRVAARVHVLFSAARMTAQAPCEEMLATIQRGLAVMTVIVLDLERRLDGHVPAALDDAVQSLFEQLSRLAAQERMAA
jgi:chemotaxis protein histidine kinase CheA